MVSVKRAFLFLALLSVVAMWQSLRLLSVANHQQDSTTTTGKQEPALNYPFDPPNVPTPSVSAASTTNHTTTTSTGVSSPQKTNNTNSLLPTNRLIHLTVFGLGHRLLRTTSAWHLAKTLNLTRMRFLWGTCGADHASGPKIFSHLFGDDEISVPQSSLVVGRGKEVLVRNDVYGYVSGQFFKDVHLPLPQIYKHPNGPFLEKLAHSDVELYKLLRDRYLFKNQIDGFMKKHKFDEHVVLGVHLRLGNGEQSHFNYAGRGISNEPEFVSHVTKLIHQFLERTRITYPDRFQTKTPLVFLATDTMALVPRFINLTDAFNVSTVVLPQIRVAANKGVTFQALQGAGTDCLDGWQAMVSDMVLLSHSDVLIATRHSSFTQSLPLSLLFDRTQTEAGPHFCEIGDTAMVCLDDLQTWLFRDDDTKMTTYSLTTTNDSKEEPVTPHKLLVQLPDVEPAKEFAHAVDLLNDNEPNSNPQDQDRSVITHTYGAKRFNPKYRFRRKKGDDSVPSWNFTDS